MTRIERVPARKAGPLERLVPDCATAFDMTAAAFSEGLVGAVPEAAPESLAPA